MPGCINVPVFYKNTWVNSSTMPFDPTVHDLVDAMLFASVVTFALGWAST